MQEPVKARCGKDRFGLLTAPAVRSSLPFGSGVLFVYGCGSRGRLEAGFPAGAAESVWRNFMARAKRRIYVTEFDMKRLDKLIDALEDFDERNKRYLEELEDELRRAKVVPSKEIPGDIVTMNSTVRLTDLDSGEEAVYSLVFPGEADYKARKISILAPIGTALIGYRVGDTLEWQAPAGIRRFRIDEILYQPESAGDFDR
jgi:regulator of nucleoside diphosphate kinase